MPSVDFVTYCCPKDIHRLHTPGELRKRVESHVTYFNTVWVIHQRCREVKFARVDDIPYISVWSEDHPGVLSAFSIPKIDRVADEKTGGLGAHYYWKYHMINHLIGLAVSNADYIVFSDCDCHMEYDQQSSWVNKGIGLLQQHQNVLIVSPADGGYLADGGVLPDGTRLTQNMSQQLFVCNRERLSNIDFNASWDLGTLAPGVEQTFPEYPWLLEGRVWRYMQANGLYRAVLPDNWRYVHDGW